MVLYKFERLLRRVEEELLKLRRRRYCQGTSKSAERRRAYSNHAGFWTTHKPGDRIEMSYGRKYVVAEDGSYRRVEAFA